MIVVSEGDIGREWRRRVSEEPRIGKAVIDGRRGRQDTVQKRDPVDTDITNTRESQNTRNINT